MVPEIRLKTNIYVSAEIRRCENLMISAVVLHKGDQERGMVLIKQYVHGQGAKIFTQIRDLNGNMNWHQPLGDVFMEEPKADQYISRQRDFDEDLWVIEVEDTKGQYSPQHQ